MLNILIIIAILSISAALTLPPPYKLINCKSNKYLFSFDFTNSLRGIAILLVMISHVSATMNTVLFSPLGGTGVALFLFMSGFGLNESFKSHGLVHYWRKKALRVLIPYFFVATVLYYCKWEFTWSSYLLDITGLKTHYWYIAFLMKWYIAFWISSKYFLRYRILVLLMMSVMILFLFPNIEAEQAFSFLTGLLVSTYIDEIKEWGDKRIVKIVCVAFLIGTFFLLLKQHPMIRTNTDNWIYNVVQLFIKLPYALSTVCVLRLFPRYANSKFLLFTGMLSYELYLFHMPFFSHLGGSLFWALLLFVASFAFCYPFHWINKKVSYFLS